MRQPSLSVETKRFAKNAYQKYDYRNREVIPGNDKNDTS